jgi:hypothetical protein
MAERISENEELIGAKPMDVLTYIVKKDPSIATLGFWTYIYKPVQYAEPEENPHLVLREEFLAQNVVQKIVESLPEEAQVGVFSRVILGNGETGHIPMMDFGIPKSDEGLVIVRERLQKGGVHNAWILETGASYHLYGKDVLSKQEWIQFMGTCLLTSVVHSRGNIEQIADPRYIGYSLKRDGNVLRLTNRGEKLFEPRVVAYIA